MLENDEQNNLKSVVILSSSQLENQTSSFRQFPEFNSNLNTNSFGPISFTQAQYLPYRPKIESKEEGAEKNSKNSQNNQKDSQYHRVDSNHLSNYYDEKEELFFLYSPRTSIQNKNKVPKAFPVSGKMADRVYSIKDNKKIKK